MAADKFCWEEIPVDKALPETDGLYGVILEGATFPDARKFSKQAGAWIVPFMRDVVYDHKVIAWLKRVLIYNLND